MTGPPNLDPLALGCVRLTSALRQGGKVCSWSIAEASLTANGTWEASSTVIKSVRCGDGLPCLASPPSLTLWGVSRAANKQLALGERLCCRWQRRLPLPNRCSGLNG